MRNIYILVCLLIFSLNFLEAQNGALAKYNTTGAYVYLRWSPTTFKELRSSVDSGYTIVRYLTHVSGVAVTNSQLLNSAVILTSTFKPKSEANIMSLAGIDQKWKDVTAGLLYSDSLSFDYTYNSGNINSYKQARDREFNLSIALMVAGLDYKIAEALGVGYKDNSALVMGNTYMYVVHKGNKSTNYQVSEPIAFTSLLITNSYSLPNISGLNSKSTPKKALIFWDKKDELKLYTAYDIFRSTNGTTFNKVNSNRYIPLTEEHQTSYIYEDSMPAQNVNYIYKIQGIDIFGDSGPFSDTVHCKSLKPPLDQYPIVDSIVNVSNNKFVLHWHFPVIAIDSVTNYQVFRSNNYNGIYTAISSILPSSTITFEDLTPLPISYYKVIATDNNGYKLESISIIAQLEDHIAPTVPTGLTGIAKKNNIIELKWNKNQESDVAGYKVFLGYNTTAEFVEVTTDNVQDTLYSMDFNMKTLKSTVYIKVKAVDHHGNYSNMSSPLTVSLPDVVPPSSPVLQDIIQGQGFITLKYYTSTSDDAKWHFIQRKSKSEQEWKEVAKYMKFSVNDTLIKSYKDTLVKTNEVYKYRVLTKDLSGNNGISAEMTGQPYASPIRSNKPTFEFDFRTINGKKCIDFKPGFDDHTRNEMTDLLVYRAIGNGPMILLNQIPATEVRSLFSIYGRVYIDKELLFGQTKTYKYKIQILYWDGSMSKLSDEVAINYTP